jgi:hypothetical protein
MLDAQPVVLVAPGMADVGAAVVGEYPLHGDAVAGEEGAGASPEDQGGGGGLVVEGLGVGQPGVSVHGGVHVAVADVGPAVHLARSAGVAVRVPIHFALRPAVGAPAAAVGDVAQLLDVDVHQLAGPGRLDAAHRFAGDPIDVPEPVDPAGDQDPVHRRGRQADPGGDRHRPQPLLPPQMHDLAHDRPRRPPR